MFIYKFVKFVKNKILETGVSKLNPNSGFSLIELMVTISIMMIITAVVLIRYSSFNSTILVTNLAYEIALSAREAQVYGLGVKGTTAGFGAGYGIHFDNSSLRLQSPSQSSYKFFADLNKNGLYDDGEQQGSDYLLPKGYYVAKFCVSGVSAWCSDSQLPISFLDITFIRPNPDAIIKTNIVGGVYSQAVICVSSPKGNQKKIIIGSAGQISVQSASEPCTTQ